MGGGHKKKYRIVDFKRVGPKEGEPLVEQVQRVRYDPCRTADIAIVAGGNHKRYILASQNMKAGDLIKTSGKVTRMAGMGTISSEVLRTWMIYIYYICYAFIVIDIVSVGLFSLSFFLHGFCLFVYVHFVVTVVASSFGGGVGGCPLVFIIQKYK